MKILVTSDLAIGAAFPHAASVGRKLREARFDTLREIVNLANHRKVEALVLAGNTLADNRIVRDDILDLLDILSLSNAPVLLLPGINDPFTPDNPFRLEPELLKSPIQIVGNAEPLEVGPSTFYPLPVVGRTPFFGGFLGQFRQRLNVEKLSIGLVCIPQADLPAPELVDECGLDVLLCGGSVAAGHQRRLVCPGTPEPVDFSGCGGHVSLIDMDVPRAPPSVESLKVGRLDWKLVDAEPNGVEQALNDLLSASTQTLLRLKVQGCLPADEILQLQAIVEEKRRRFFFLEARMRVSPKVPENVPHPLLKSLLTRLAADYAEGKLDPSELGPVPSEAEIARWAILRLHELLGESPNQELPCI